MFGCHFSFNITLQKENNFKKHISKIQNFLEYEEKTYVFKPLTISKIINLALVTPISTDIINPMNTIQKNFLWKSKYPKRKHETFLNDSMILSEIVGLQCSWIQKLYEKNSPMENKSS